MINSDISIDSVLRKLFSNGKKPPISRFTELFQSLAITENQKEKDMNSPSTVNNNKEIKNENNSVIDPNKIRKGQDKRSSIIIKGIPSFLNPEDIYFLVKQFYNNVNFFYIPPYIQKQKQYMYAFVNVTHYKGIIHIYNGFMKLKQEYSNNSGLDFSQIELLYSKTQGKSALINRYTDK